MYSNDLCCSSFGNYKNRLWPPYLITSSLIRNLIRLNTHICADTIASLHNTAHCLIVNIQNPKSVCLMIWLMQAQAAAFDTDSIYNICAFTMCECVESRTKSRTNILFVSSDRYMCFWWFYLGPHFVCLCIQPNLYKSGNFIQFR